MKSKFELLNLTRLLTNGIVGGSPAKYHVEQSSHKKNSLNYKLRAEKVAQQFIEGSYSYNANAKEEQVNDDENDQMLRVNALFGERPPKDHVFSLEFCESGVTESPAIKARRESLLEKHTDLEEYEEQDVLDGIVKLSEAQVKKFIDGRRGWPKFQKVCSEGCTCKAMCYFPNKSTISKE